MPAPHKRKVFCIKLRHEENHFNVDQNQSVYLTCNHVTPHKASKLNRTSLQQCFTPCVWDIECHTKKKSVGFHRQCVTRFSIRIISIKQQFAWFCMLQSRAAQGPGNLGIGKAPNFLKNWPLIKTTHLIIKMHKMMLEILQIFVS